jgi:hypothetical protein
MSEEGIHLLVASLRRKLWKTFSLFAWCLVAWCGIVPLNSIFVYITVLKAFERGNAWQRAFMAGEVVQILIEVLLVEAIECVWMNFLVLG